MPNKLLQQRVQKITGRPVTMKDIANIKAEVNKDLKSNEMEDVVPFLLDKDGFVEVAVDEEDNFQSLFFQDRQMKSVFDKFPELVMVDATYKLLDLRLPVYIMIVVDGNGLTEVVSIFILAEETEKCMETAIEFFKKK